MTRFNCLFLAAAAVVFCASGARGQDGFCMVNGTTTGGAGGATVTVTNDTDFVTQVTAAGARIIQVEGVISFSRVTPTPNKTIIGLGTNATLYGNLNIANITNVIVRNLRVSYPGNDGITVWNAQHVWVDHCTFFDCGDGSCDMSRGSQYVTVSWCKFLYPTMADHQFTMIADGYNDGAGTTNYGYYTLHHNWWSTGADQRMPASTDGRIHMYNNYFNCTNNYYCSNPRIGTEIYSVSNYYSGVLNPTMVSSGTGGKFRISGNIYSGCSGTIDPGTNALGADLYPPPYAYTADPAANVPAIVMAGAGAPGPDTVPIPPKIWTGGGANNNLTNANGNWSLNESPKLYDTMTFAGTTRLTPSNNFTAGCEFPALNFSNNAGAFVLGGNRIGLGIGITDDSASVQTINLNMDFTYGANHYPTNRYFTVSSNAGSLVINGNLSGGTSNYVFALIKQGDGTLALNGTNTFIGQVRLNGGLVKFSVLATNLPGSLGGSGALLFNGGGLQWAPGNTADISARTVTINAGGATLDIGTNSVTLANRIGNGGAGALTKSGTGTLTFNATNNYRSDTIIAQGVLALGAGGLLTNSPQIVLSNNAALDVSGRSDGTLTLASGKALRGNGSVLGSVTAASGTTVSPGFSIGTLAITNSLILQAGSTNVMEIDAAAGTHDVIVGMAGVSYGGTLIVSNLNGELAPGQSYQLFTAASYTNAFSVLRLPSLTGRLVWTNRLAIDGTLAVVLPVNTAPTNIVAVASGNALDLSWPEDHTGWALQTNATGITASNAWFEYPPGSGSRNTNHVILTIVPNQTNVFLRLVYP